MDGVFVFQVFWGLKVDLRCVVARDILVVMQLIGPFMCIVCVGACFVLACFNEEHDCSWDFSERMRKGCALQEDMKETL